METIKIFQMKSQGPDSGWALAARDAEIHTGRTVNHPAYDFALVPSDKKGEAYFIVTFEGGCLSPSSPADTVYHCPPGTSDKSSLKSFLWKKVEVGNKYRFQNVMTGTYLTEMQKGGRCWLTDKQDNSTLWEIKFLSDKEKKLPQLPQLPQVDSSPLESSLGMTSPKLPNSITPILTKFEILPFVLVNEANDKTWQLQHSPYYTLARFTSWETDEETFHYNSARSGNPDTKVWEYREAWSIETSKSFSITVGFSVTVGTGEKAPIKKEATLSFEFTHSWSETYSRTSEKMNSLTVEIPAGTAKCLFKRKDHLELRRLDGVLVREWDYWAGTRTVSYPSGEGDASGLEISLDPDDFDALIEKANQMGVPLETYLASYLQNAIQKLSSDQARSNKVPVTVRVVRS